MTQAKPSPTETGTIDWNGYHLKLARIGVQWRCDLFRGGKHYGRRWFRFESQARQWFFNLVGYADHN